MKKILFILLLVLSVVAMACATVDFNTKNTVTIKNDETGNRYSCVVDFQNKNSAGAECSFYIQKGATVFKCVVNFEKAKTFTISEDCTVEIELKKPAENIDAAATQKK